MDKSKVLCALCETLRVLSVKTLDFLNTKGTKVEHKGHEGLFNSGMIP
jgi:hypothetical protein